MKYNRFMGEYDDNTIYQAGDVVNFDGASYYRKVPGKGISPIARKKPYTVWSRLNEALSTIFPLGGSGGGASLPDAAPYQQLVTDGEGKWIPVDRLGYTETDEAQVYNETVELVLNSSGNYVEANGVVFSHGHFVNGRKYKVIFDGVVYDNLVASDESGYAAIGSEAYNSFTDSMPFYICTWDQSGNVYVGVYAQPSLAGTMSVAIYAYEENVHTIPEKYLPKNIPGYVQLVEIYPEVGKTTLAELQAVDGPKYLKYVDGGLVYKGWLAFTGNNTYEYEIINNSNSIQYIMKLVFDDDGVLSSINNEFITGFYLADTTGNAYWCYVDTDGTFKVQQQNVAP